MSIISDNNYKVETFFTIRLFKFSEAQRFLIPQRQNSQPVSSFRYNPNHNRVHHRNSFTHSQGFLANRQDTSREIFQTRPGQQLSPSFDNRRKSIFRFQNTIAGHHQTKKHPFDSSEHIPKPSASESVKHASAHKPFHVDHKISKPEFSFLSAMNSNFKPTIPLKPPSQHILRTPPVRNWPPRNPAIQNTGIAGPMMFNPVHRRRPFQPSYVNNRPRQMHQRRFHPPMRISTGNLSGQQGLLGSPSVLNAIPNILPENTVIAPAEEKSDVVKKDISLQNPTEHTNKNPDHLTVAISSLNAEPLTKPVETAIKSVTVPKQKPLRKTIKAKKHKSGARKTKKNVTKQKATKPSKPLPSKVVKKPKERPSKSKTKKNEKITPAPKKESKPRIITDAPTKPPTTTEMSPVDDDFLPGGSSGSWEMPDHDFPNSGSQEVMNVFGRERFLPGCLCTMFCGHGFEFAGFCGASSAEFFRPRLSKCCPVKNGPGGNSGHMPFFFDD